MDCDLLLSGVSAKTFVQQPPLQILTEETISIAIPDISSIGDDSVASASESPYTEETITIPSSHKEIKEKSAEILQGVSSRLEAVQKLNAFVFDYLEKTPVIGVPNGLQALRSKKGDCNEHTALFVSLARAAKIPTRIAAGLVYSERIGKSFYYHAWPEVLIQDTWLAVDPTFGQVPADATHIKVVEGDLDQQVAIMGLLGNISLTLIEAE